MSLPHLSPDTLAACTQAAYDHDPACYCVFHWNYADYPPRHKFHKIPTKWLGVSIWRDDASSDFGSFVLRCMSESGPDLLRQLRQALADAAAPPPPPVPPPQPMPPPVRQPGQGWIASAPQTTQERPAFPVGFP